MLDHIPCYQSDTQVHRLTQGPLGGCACVLTFSHCSHTPRGHLSQKPFSHKNTSLRNCSHSAETLCSGTVLTVREHLVHCENTSLQCKNTCLRSLDTHNTMAPLPGNQAATPLLALLLLCYEGYGAALDALEPPPSLDNLPKHQQWSTTLPPHFFDSLDRFEYPV